MYQVQTNLSVQTVQTNCGVEVGGGICKSVITPAPNYTFANPPSNLSPVVGLHGEVGLHLIHCQKEKPVRQPVGHMLTRNDCLQHTCGFIMLLVMTY